MRDEGSVEGFLDLLGARILEFMRKCSRLLEIYCTPYEDPSFKFGIRYRHKTPAEERQYQRFLRHKKQLWHLHTLPILKIIKIISQKSALFTYLCLTGVRNSGERMDEKESSF